MATYRNYILFFIIISQVNHVYAQSLYKTPSGKRYYLATCRMVETVSQKLNGQEDIDTYSLTPCKICKPSSKYVLRSAYSNSNKAVGISNTVQCKGKTKRGTRCKHKTRNANGYCYQHTKQNSRTNTSYKNLSTKPYTKRCGARTKSRGYCKRKVKGGGRCYQHR